MADNEGAQITPEEEIIQENKQADAAVSSKNGHKWYIANVVSGQEQKISNEIKAMVSSGKYPQISDSIVPVKNVLKVRRGKKVQEAQRLFPGYVFVCMLCNGESQDVIRSITKVIGFLGPKGKPEPVSDEKMQSIISGMNQDATEAADVEDFDIGENVKVIQGPFESFTGVVEEVDSEKKTMKLSISIFGRATPVELRTSEVEKL